MASTEMIQKCRQTLSTPKFDPPEITWPDFESLCITWPDSEPQGLPDIKLSDVFGRSIILISLDTSC